MRRNELDFERRVWSLPGSRTKNGFAHSVPLSSLAISIIEEALFDAGDDSIFVFPSGDGALPAMAVAKSIERARERFGIEHWTAHDLRRTALTTMAKLGVTPIAYEPEKRQALELWADRLKAIVTGEAAAEVVPLHTERRGR